MKRIKTTFKSENISTFKKKLFKWSEYSKTSIFLDSNNYPQRIGNLDTILALDPYSKLAFTNNNSLEKLDAYLNKTQDWIFGYFSYDLKNELENLESNNISGYSLPNLFFFQPKKIWLIKSGNIEAHYLNESEIISDWNKINSQNIDDSYEQAEIKLFPRLSKLQYEEKVNKLLFHINRGDVYEANFCMEWFSNNSVICPQKVFQKLNQISKNPMSAYLKHNHIQHVPPGRQH